jgi:choline dehydrogenase-like flavoprotein
VTSVRFSLGQGRFASVRARQVVVAGGGLETARLLLASTSVQPAGLGNACDQLGRHYMVHPLAEVGAVHSVVPSLLGAGGYRVSHDGVWVRSVLALRPDLVAAEGLPSLGFALWYPDPRDPSHGDPLLSSYALVRAALARHGGFKGTGMHRRYAAIEQPRAHVGNVTAGLPELGRYLGYWARHRWLGKRTLPSFTRMPAGATYRLRFDAEQLPDPANRVELSRQTDAHGMPRLTVRHRVTDRDRELIHRCVVRMSEQLTATGAASVTPPTRDEIDALPLYDGTHQMGLARMADRPECGVVDADLRVFGAPNTWVASSAVFATSGMAGPTLTIVALSLRLADRLARELGAR